jgi:LPXTG-motif cell wall-anchored protein
MTLPRVLVVGAAAVLLVPAVGLVAAAPASAAETAGPAVLTVDLPRSIALSGGPAPFTATIDNSQGGAYTATDLTFELWGPGGGDTLFPYYGVRFTHAGKVYPGQYNQTGSVTVHVPDLGSLGAGETRTESFTISVVRQPSAPAGTRSSRQQRLASARPGQQSPAGTSAATVSTAAEVSCGEPEPQWHLHVDAVLRGTPAPAEGSGAQPVSPVPGESVVVARAVADRPFARPTFSLAGLGGDYAAGGAPRAFTLRLYNGTVSDYAREVPHVWFDSPLKPADVVLELWDGTGWVPLAVTQSPNNVVVAIVGDAHGVSLPSGSTRTWKLRLGFRAGAKPGARIASGATFLGTYDAGSTYTCARFSVVKAAGAPGSQLPDTGGAVGLGLLGAGLLVAGAGAVTAARRRRTAA